MDDDKQVERRSPIERVAWLARFLDISVSAAYAAVREKRIPDNCIVRLGRNVRVHRDNVREWANGGGQVATS